MNLLKLKIEGLIILFGKNDKRNEKKYKIYKKNKNKKN